MPSDERRAVRKTVTSSAWLSLSSSTSTSMSPPGCLRLARLTGEQIRSPRGRSGLIPLLPIVRCYESFGLSCRQYALLSQDTQLWSVASYRESCPSSMRSPGHPATVNRPQGPEVVTALRFWVCLSRERLLQRSWLVPLEQRPRV
jgi:hypothetical protein